MAQDTDELLTYYGRHKVEVDTAADDWSLFLLDYLRCVGPMTQSGLAADTGFGERRTESIVATLLRDSLLDKSTVTGLVAIADRGRQLLEDTFGETTAEIEEEVRFQTFDGEFVQRLKAGDSEAVERFTSYFGNVLRLKLRTRLREPDLIENALQTTLLRVLQNLREGGGIRNPEKLGAFVYAVCNNVIREHLRSGAWDELIEEPVDQSVDLDANLLSEDLKAALEEIMTHLSKKDQSILRAVFLEGADKAELCARFRIDEPYLRVLGDRARKFFDPWIERPQSTE